MCDVNSSEKESFTPDVVNSLKNPQLLSAIRAILYSNNERNMNAFMRTFLSSTLIVLIKDTPKIPDEEILKYDPTGYLTYEKGTQLPLVQLNSETGRFILPVFTETKFVHQIKGLNHFHGLAISAIDLLEMSLVAESSSVYINPGSQEYIALDQYLIQEIVKDLKNNSKIPEQEIMTLNGHSF